MTLRRLIPRERGQVLLVGALTLTMFLGFVGLVIDGGFYYTERRQAQNGADEAAISAARVLGAGRSTSDATSAAIDYAQANGFEAGEVTVHIPPVSGEHIGEDGYAEVVIDRDPNTFFIHMVLDAGTVSARGVAGYEVTTVAGSGYAIFAMNTDCGVSDALEMSGSDNALIGLMHSNSHIKVSGSNNDFDGGTTYVCGMDNSGSGNAYDPSPSSAGQEPFPVDYEYSDFQDVPCTIEFTADTDLSSVPAAWVGGNSSSGQLIPGVYCSTKKLTLSGSDVTGQVTLVAMEELSVSGSNFNLTPHWQQVLFFTESNSSSALDMSGSGGSWEGIMVAPNGKAKMQGQANLTISGSILADTVQVSGSDFSITALDYVEGSGNPPVVSLVE